MWKRLLVGVVLSGALVSILYVLYPSRTILEIAGAQTGRAIWCAEMAEDEEFVLSFVHSVNRRPVYETLRAAGDHLIIVKSRFDAFGAGMPETSTQDGKLAVGPDGWLEWTVNRPVPEVVVRVGRVANHSLRVKGRETALADLAEPGTPLALRVRAASVFGIWKGKCIW